MDNPSLQFLGAAGTVTGSKHLIRTRAGDFLLDCGLFQGLKELRARNRQSPRFEPKKLRAVVLTHAHIDHSGYLPLLAKKGFAGPVFCTPATADLLGVLLRDAAHLQEEEAAHANRYGWSRHKPALPLYTTADAERALALLAPRRYSERFEVLTGSTCLFRRAGHILGSATVDLEFDTNPMTTLMGSGDLGRWGRPILRDPEPVAHADVLLVESTYGDRVHSADAAEALARVIDRMVTNQGVLVVPAFAVGRTQELIWTMRQLEDAGRIPSIPVYIDSPMAINVTDIYCRYPEDHDLDMKLLMDEKRCPLCCKQYHLARTATESKALNGLSGPLVIISASGMATGGRVLHHLKTRLPDEKTTVLLPGYQTAGTRGRALQDGARSVRIHGETVPVRARIETVDGLSAHADRNEILRWLKAFQRPPRKTYVIHGEPHAAEALAEGIRTGFRWNVEVARDGATIGLTA